MHLAEVHPRLGAQHGLADIGESGDAAGAVRAQLAVILGPHLALRHFLDIAARQLPLAAQFGQAGGNVDQRIGIGVGPGSVIDIDRRFAAGGLQIDLPHGHLERADMDFLRAANWPGGDTDFELGIDVGHGLRAPWVGGMGKRLASEPSLRPC